MANFSNLALTVNGIEALLRAQAGERLILSKIGLGSGSAANGTSLTSLVTPKLMMPVSGKEINEESGYMTISATMTNENITEGFYWRETGLFYEDSNGNDVLFAYTCVTNNEYDYIPAYSDQRYVKHVRIADIVADTANITIKEEEGLLYVDTLTFELFKKEVNLKIEEAGNASSIKDAFVSRWEENGGDTIVEKNLIEYITNKITNEKICNGEFSFFNVIFTDGFPNCGAYGLVKYRRHLDAYVTVTMTGERHGTAEFVARFILGESEWNHSWELLLSELDVVDNLESTATNLPLSANQGRLLKSGMGYMVLTAKEVTVDMGTVNADTVAEKTFTVTVPNSIKFLIEKYLPKGYHIAVRFVSAHGDYALIKDFGTIEPGTLNDGGSTFEGIVSCRNISTKPQNISIELTYIIGIEITRLNQIT